jgi:hypothetical protein
VPTKAGVNFARGCACRFAATARADANSALPQVPTEAAPRPATPLRGLRASAILEIPFSARFILGMPVSKRIIFGEPVVRASFLVCARFIFGEPVSACIIWDMPVIVRIGLNIPAIKHHFRHAGHQVKSS